MWPRCGRRARVARQSRNGCAADHTAPRGQSPTPRSGADSALAGEFLEQGLDPVRELPESHRKDEGRQSIPARDHLDLALGPHRAEEKSASSAVGYAAHRGLIPRQLMLAIQQQERWTKTGKGRERPLIVR